MTEIPMKGGDEYDALTGWRKYCKWKAGDRSRIKRGYRRRCRRLARQELRTSI